MSSRWLLHVFALDEALVFKSEMCLHADFTFLSVSNILSNALAVERILVALSKTHLTRHFAKRTLLSFIMAQHMGPCIEQHANDVFDNEKVNPCIGDNCRASLRIHFSAYNFFQQHRWLMLLNSQRMSYLDPPEVSGEESASHPTLILACQNEVLHIKKWL